MKLPKKKNKDHINIYFHVGENSGVGMYRQYQPAEALRRNNLANVMINDFKWGTGDHHIPDHKALFELSNWADIIITGRIDQPDWLAQWGGIREFFNVPVIMDTDDNVRFVPITNPGRQGYFPGSEAEKWNRMAFTKVFDAITVSTDNLKEFHDKEHPRIYVVPNGIDFDHWSNFDLNYPKLKEKQDDKYIRICFNGSGSHTDGFKMIKQPLLRIMEEYKNVKFLCPKNFEGVFNEYPEGVKKRIEYFPWITLKDFPKAMAELSIDIGLAPLTDNMFNRAKSNLRWMEFSALKIPVICSPAEAYKNVVDKKTGLLAREKEDWYNSIKSLIESPAQRKKLAGQAYKEIEEQFNIDKNAEKTLSIYKETIEKHHDFFGSKKKFVRHTTRKNEKGWREIK